jgi:hypothetical protein
VFGKIAESADRARSPQASIESVVATSTARRRDTPVEEGVDEGAGGYGTAACMTVIHSIGRATSLGKALVRTESGISIESLNPWVFP